MLYVVAIIIFILFLPFFISFYIYFDKNVKRLYFAIYIFGFIKLTSGYVKPRNAFSFYLHLKNKAIIIDKNILKLFDGNFNVFNVIQLKSLQVYLDISTNNENSVAVVFLLNSLFNILSKCVYSKNYILSPRYSIKLKYEKPNFSLKVKCTLFFNLFCITCNLITNYIIKGVYNAKIRQKQSNWGNFK